MKSISQYLHAHNHIIAISGKSGCGNTSTSRYIAEKLELELINYTFRSLAEERNTSLEHVMRQARQNDDIDRYVDTRQVELSRKSPSVLASRLAIWLRPDAFLRVYLYAETSIRISRIMTRENWSYEAASEHTTARDSNDHERYLRIYNINNDEYEFADLILNAGVLNIAEIYKEVEKELELRVQKARENNR